MASFTDLVAGRIQQQQHEFLAGLSPEPRGTFEDELAACMQSWWHPLQSNSPGAQVEDLPATPAAAVDGSRAVRALNTGADWVVAQALLLGPNGLQLTAADTMLLRGEIERPAVDRCAALLMRSLELDLALKFAQREPCELLLLDGSLYAELPHLIYKSLAVHGHEDLPLLVLQRYLDLFACCETRGIVLLGLAKSARSTVLGRALLCASEFGDHLRQVPSPETQAMASTWIAPDISGSAPHADVLPFSAWSESDRWEAVPSVLPTDAEILHRWTSGAGFCNPILLGKASFGHRSGPVAEDPGSLAAQFTGKLFTPAERRDILRRLRTAPAIGTFYMRLAPGEDVLRVDALASAFGLDQRLLEFHHQSLSHRAAERLVGYVLRDYGGANVYNAALWVVDREVRLHADTVDRIYLSVLRRQLNVPVQYDRSTRRFVR